MTVMTSVVSTINKIAMRFQREEFLHDDEDIDLNGQDIYVKTAKDLPLEGEADIKYHISDTMMIMQWKEGLYREFNPYICGVDMQYRDAPRTFRHNPEIVDFSAELASISLDQVRNGSSPSLAVYYNLIALRADLDMLRRLYVTNPTKSLMDMISRGSFSDAERNATEWFYREHKALYTLLSSAARSKNDMVTSVVDALHHNEASLTWDKEKNRPVFKTNDIKVYL